MNQRNAKKLRRFFEELERRGLGLPEMYQKAPTYYYRRAGDMDFHELTKAVAANGGQPIHEDDNFKMLDKMIDVPINHLQRMKKYYKEHGLQGYPMYIADLRRKILNHLERVKAKEETEITLGEMKTMRGWLKFFDRIKMILLMIFNLQVEWEEYGEKEKQQPKT